MHCDNKCFVIGPVRNTWHVTALACMLLTSAVAAERRGYRPSSQQTQKEDAVEADRGLEEDVELRAQVPTGSYSAAALS